jgi:hypothetical protein
MGEGQSQTVTARLKAKSFGGKTQKRVHGRIKGARCALPTNDFLVHMLFDGDLRQRPAIVAFVAANSKLFDPLFLHV